MENTTVKEMVYGTRASWEASKIIIQAAKIPQKRWTKTHAWGVDNNGKEWKATHLYAYEYREGQKPFLHKITIDDYRLQEVVGKLLQRI